MGKTEERAAARERADAIRREHAGQVAAGGLRSMREGLLAFDRASAEAECDGYIAESDSWNKFDEARVQRHGTARLHMLEGSGIFIRRGCRFCVGSGSNIYLRHGARLFVLGNFSLWGNDRLRGDDGGCLVLGNGYMNLGVNVDCASHVHIGDAVVSYGAYITDSDWHSIFDSDGNRVNPNSPVVFGGHVWVGQGATVLKGVTIGAGSVVGAKSLVCDDVPAGCVVAGNPARVVRSGIRWK